MHPVATLRVELRPVATLRVTSFTELVTENNLMASTGISSSSSVEKVGVLVELTQWLETSAEILPSLAENYALKLVEANVTSIDILQRAGGLLVFIYCM